MSRHRNVRRHFSEDYYDEDDIYGRSVEDEHISPEDESFLYNRNCNRQDISLYLKDIKLNDTSSTSNANDSQKSESHEDEVDESDSNVLAEVRKSSNQPIKIIRPSNVTPTKRFVVTDTKSDEGTKPKNLNDGETSSDKPYLKRNLQPAETNESGNKKSSIAEQRENVESDVSRPKKEILSSDEPVSVSVPHNSGKENVHLIIIGHVDAGKSTLIGHLLFKLGYVSKKLIQKYEHESEKIGKQSFVYAWVLDEIEEERERGITLDVGQSKFETSSKSVILLDALGHKDFIPNMIGGATRADAALLVVDATVGEFETGFESGGQTREHTILVRSLGVSQLIIAVNKMDNVSWSQERFNEIRSKLGVFLRQIGFKENELLYVPVSGLIGVNLSETPVGIPPAIWYQGLSLVEAIDQLKPPERAINKYLRMCINDVYKHMGTQYVSGRIETGFMSVGNKVCLQPQNETAVIKSLAIDESNEHTVLAGNSVNVVLTNVNTDRINVGDVICDVDHPIPVCDTFEAKIVVFDVVRPITIGYMISFHWLSLVDSVVIKTLNAQLNKVTGEIVKKRPRVLCKNMAANVTICTSRPICLELYKDYREFGRFMLRDCGKTVAAGLVTKIL